ncbi:hypothetical protein [Bradyrhizobium diazoefficiens]|uniref:hypothetical protein n=1 Tax=Bradyrhizobium diazoefficiens TaxID=1355477 RepID=UPI0036F267BB
MLQLEAQLGDRDVTIELSEPAKAWLVQHGYDEQMGARPMARVIQEHIKKPLADEVLFGKLKSGGHVRVVLVKDEADETKEKIGFEFVEGPVTPKQEKLPGARKRPPGKPKPGGPGGSKGRELTRRTRGRCLRPPRGRWSRLDRRVMKSKRPAVQPAFLFVSQCGALSAGVRRGCRRRPRFLRRGWPCAGGSGRLHRDDDRIRLVIGCRARRGIDPHADDTAQQEIAGKAGGAAGLYVAAERDDLRLVAVLLEGDGDVGVPLDDHGAGRRAGGRNLHSADDGFNA